MSEINYLSKGRKVLPNLPIILLNAFVAETSSSGHQLCVTRLIKPFKSQVEEGSQMQSAQINILCPLTLEMPTWHFLSLVA